MNNEIIKRQNEINSFELAEKFVVSLNKKIKELKEIEKLEKRKRHHKLFRAAIAGIGLATLTGCTSFGSTQMFSNSDKGFVMFAGDAEGVRAWNDGINGLITNTKASKDVKSSYWQNRDKETNVRRLRTPYFSERHPRFGGFGRGRSFNEVVNDYDIPPQK